MRSVKRTLRASLASCLAHCGSFQFREPLARYLHMKLFANLPAQDSVVCARYKDGSRLRLDLRMEFVSFYLGEYEPANLATLLSFLPDDGVFVDIGASIGFFSIPVAHRTRKSGARVYAFEPIGRNYAELLANIRLNDLERNITPVNLAVSNLNGRLPMQIAAAGEQTANAIPLMGWDGYKLPYPRCEADAVRFDDWVRNAGIRKIDVVKMDIEGHELHALQGMLETLEKHRPVVYAECNAFIFKKQGVTMHDVVGLLSPLEYDYYRITERKLKKIEMMPDYAQDVFLIPRNRMGSPTRAEAASSPGARVCAP